MAIPRFTEYVLDEFEVDWLRDVYSSASEPQQDPRTPRFGHPGLINSEETKQAMTFSPMSLRF